MNDNHQPFYPRGSQSFLDGYEDGLLSNPQAWRLRQLCSSDYWRGYRAGCSDARIARQKLPEELRVKSPHN